MQTYWDLSEKQRAELTPEQVRAFVDVDLMQEGIINPKPPVLEEITELRLEKASFFAVKGLSQYEDPFPSVLFTTAEDAARFIDLRPREKHNDWQTNTTYCKDPGTLVVYPVETAPEQQVVAARSQLVENRTKKERNEKLSAEYRKACDTAAKVVNAVWDDHRECQAKGEAGKRIVETFEEYKRMAGGNADLAVGFLRKTFKPEAVAEAFEWHGIIAPAGAEAQMPERPVGRPAVAAKTTANDAPF